MNKLQRAFVAMCYLVLYIGLGLSGYYLNSGLLGICFMLSNMYILMRAVEFIFNWLGDNKGDKGVNN